MEHFSSDNRMDLGSRAGGWGTWREVQVLANPVPLGMELSRSDCATSGGSLCSGTTGRVQRALRKKTTMTITWNDPAENEKTFKHKFKMRNWGDCIVESALVRSGKGILPTKCSQLTLTVRDMSTGLPWGCSGKEATCQFRGHRFEPWPGRSHTPRSN